MTQAVQRRAEVGCARWAAGPLGLPHRQHCEENNHEHHKDECSSQESLIRYTASAIASAINPALCFMQEPCDEELRRFRSVERLLLEELLNVELQGL